MDSGSRAEQSSAMDLDDWVKTLPQEEEGLARFFQHGPGTFSARGRSALALTEPDASGGDPGSEGDAPEPVELDEAGFRGALRRALVSPGAHRVELWERRDGEWRVARRAAPGAAGAFAAELGEGAAGSPVGGPDRGGTGAGGASPASAGPSRDGERVVAVFPVPGGGAGALPAIGIAVWDPSPRLLRAGEVRDNAELRGLRRTLSALDPTSVVAPQAPAKARAGGGGGDGDTGLDPGSETGTGDAARDRLLAAVAEAAPSAVTSLRPKASFGVGELRADLGRLAGEGAADRHRDVADVAAAAGALAGLLAFSGLTADLSLRGSVRLAPLTAPGHARVDVGALRALSVFGGGGSGGAGGGSGFSLYALLNRCRTPGGSRLLRAWLQSPLTDLDEIRARHELVGAGVDDPELLSQLRDSQLRGVPDVGALTSKLERRAATLQDLCGLYRASSRLSGIQAAVEAYSGGSEAARALLESRFARPLAEAHAPDALARFEELLEAAVDLDRVPDEYLISPAYDEGLRETRAARDEVEEEIERLAAAAAADLGLALDKTIKLEWLRAGNARTRCLRVTAKEERSARAALQARYVELETRKDGVKFTNGPLRRAAERLSKLEAEYEARQASLARQVVDVAASFAPVWRRVAELLAELDVLLAFSDAALSAGPTRYARPTMLDLDAGEISLIGLRHPLVEAQAGSGRDYVPNDCVLRADSSWLDVITGPNMGGKSTHIRAVGACVLLSQVGSWVPCDSARVAVRDSIFARVGAGDDASRGISTFMAEMLEAGAILRAAGPGSLVLVDELGRGTSTADGLGLAVAVSEALLRAGAATLFATHFHELTRLAAADPRVALHHVRARVDQATARVTMLYAVRPGACDESFGIHVARVARFPPEVVADAERRALGIHLEEGGDAAREAADAAASPAASPSRGPTPDPKRARSESVPSGTASPAASPPPGADEDDVPPAVLRALRDFVELPQGAPAAARDAWLREAEAALGQLAASEV